MKGRRVLVCGGSSGIGQATARMCADEGARVAVIGRRRDGVAATADDIGGHGIIADMSREEEAMAAVGEAAAALGGIDGLVNCIGAADFSPLDDTSLALINAILGQNLVTHMLACRAALPHLRQSPDAAIVNVSALAGILPGVASAPYAAAKAGVIQFTKTIAAQLAPGIRANSVCPGAVRTQGMMDGFLAGKTQAEIDAFVGRYACRRLAEPDEIAGLILFLLSAEASYLTGCNYVADGGRSYH